MIRVEKLNKTYDRHRRNANHVLHDVSFTLPDTGFVCILGASGCGKTSLLNAIGGLDRFDNGLLETGDTAVHRFGTRQMEEERNRSFGYIFQNYYLLTDHSVAYNVYLGMHSQKLTHGEKMKRIREALRAVDMENYAKRIVGELSGGQQQRVAIARALARRPRVIFADEPTGNLDEANTLNICSLLRKISRTSLVVMVTHEERIARFYADRIITLEDGKIIRDSDSFRREDLMSEGSAIYSEDYLRRDVGGEGEELNLCLLREEGAAPVHLTVVALRDRILIKTDDPRTVSCTSADEAPVVVEGHRAVLSLEEIDREAEVIQRGDKETTGSTRAGHGIGFSMQFRESVRLTRAKGVKRFGTWIFLVALTVLMTLTVSDFLNVSHIDPEDFITTDSHYLQIEVSRGENLPAKTDEVLKMIPHFLDYLDASGVELDYLPYSGNAPTFSVKTFPQLQEVSVTFKNFTTVPLSHLNPEDLILGRMPERDDEIVIDRWVLDAALEERGILQNSIPDFSYFLGKRLHYYKNKYSPEIVGICDSGEPALYCSPEGSFSSAHLPVMKLSELQALYPGEYDNVTLGDYECFVVSTNLGTSYSIGSLYRLDSRTSLRIVGLNSRKTAEVSGYVISSDIPGIIDPNINIGDIVNIGDLVPVVIPVSTPSDYLKLDTYASLIIADGMAERLNRDMTTNFVHLYCSDKNALKEYLAQGLPEELDGLIQIKVIDRYADADAAYREETRVKTDARVIVIATVMLLSMVMLYLLQRAKVQERIGMIAVYRLLGIPGRKLISVFCMESFLLTLYSVLPASVLTWAVLEVLERAEAVGVVSFLTLPITLCCYLAILVFFVAVSVLPTVRLLRMPPAQLAGKYDL